MSKNLLINANDMSIFEPRRYYQEYEGTFITATNKSEDDTLDTSRYIEVTEIWGNTVQDENNLEDIQSVGELYVDEEGQPILDDLGREQYKVEIGSCNSNLLRKEWLNREVDSSGVVNYVFVLNVDEIFPIKSLTYKFTRNKGSNVQCLLYEYDENNRLFNSHYFYNPNMIYNMILAENTKKVKLIVRPTKNNPIYNNDLDNYFNNEYDIRITINESAMYVPHQSNKTTILLPCQLQKVGDVYDRLYWDSEKGKYVVEKRVDKPNVDKLYFLGYTFTSTDYFANAYQVSAFSNTCNIYTGKNYLFVTDKYCPTSINDLATGKCAGFGVRNAATYISVPNEELETIDFNGLEKWWNDNKSKIKMYAISHTPQLIETNITEKIQLPCYKEETHIFVNSTVDATMKVLVPYKEII